MANDILYPAVFSGDLERVTSLLQHDGIDVNMKAGRAQLAPLHHAVKKNFVEIAELLLQHPEIDVNAQDRSSRTPLHLACRKGFTEIVAKLLNYEDKINVNARAKGGITPLHLAAFSENDEIVSLLLKHPEIDLDARTDEEGMTALHMSACSGSDSIVKMILDEHRRTKVEEQLRPIINGLDKLGRTPLHYAACEQRLDVVNELFKSPAVHVNTGDRDSFTALHLATRKGHVAMVELLLTHPEIDPNITAKSNQATLKLAKSIQESAVWGELPRPRLSDYIVSEICSKMTALHLALEIVEEELGPDDDPREVVMALVTAFLAHPDTDVTIENNKRQSPMDLAVQRKFERVLVGLIRKSFDVCDVCGKLIKSYVTKKSYESLIMAILKEIHVHLDSLDLMGTRKKYAVTLIHKVAFAGYDKLLQILLSIPALSDVNLEDSDKQTPLHYAAIAGHTTVVKVLIEKPGLRANQEDRYNRTALQIAVMSERKDIEKLLLERSEVKDWVDRLYRDRQVYVDAANAILVGAALIASVTYAGWLQPPLGYTPYYEYPVSDPAPPDTYQVFAAVKQHMSARIFWACNSLSFFFAIATVISGAGAVLPMFDAFIGEEVRVVRRYLLLTSLLLVFAVTFVLGAFAAAGFASLPPIFSLEMNMVTTSVIGVMIVELESVGNHSPEEELHQKPSVELVSSGAEIVGEPEFLCRRNRFYWPDVAIVPTGQSSRNDCPVRRWSAWE
ncbi:hypothetical protein R1sor_020497 [Riccia sorocarpa]|uniref:PGG domain-containing protein n=1 Tax=Riccia sorocarpa TaxID=122646 RepID=A0ABD3IJ82_9MARC